jgi:hypothetical protein
MKAIFALILVVILVSLIFSTGSADALKNQDSRVKYKLLPSDFSSVGGYSAWMSPKNAFALGDSPLKLQSYNWTAWDLFWPGKECVTVGPRVDKITLFYQEGYKWENDGSEYCLVRD